MQLPLAFIGSIGFPEMMVILVVGLLVFGSRLPEVGRSLGRGLMEFKKGLSGIKDEVDAVNTDADRRIEAELERRIAEPEEPETIMSPGPSPTPEPQTVVEPTPDPGSTPVKSDTGERSPDEPTSTDPGSIHHFPNT